MNEFAYVTPTSKTFEDACVSLRKAVEQAGWALMGGYDFGETLAAKGFVQDSRYKTFDVCHAGHANKMLSADKLVSMCMPCSIVVMTVGSQVQFATVRPGMMLPAMFGQTVAPLHEDIEGIDGEIRSILETAAR